MMNLLIIEQFTLLIKQIEGDYSGAQMDNNVKELTMNKFKLKANKTALAAIKKLDFEITDESDVKGIAGIGEGTRRRIKEILTLGYLSELENNKYDKQKQQKIKAIQELEQIIGVGNATAKDLVINHNIKGVADLKKSIKNKTIVVNDKVKLGLKYYGVVQGSIPRSEIADIEKYLRKEVAKIDSQLQIMICGSYRRGRKTSGDIDVLIYHPDAKTSKEIINPTKYDLEPYLEIFVNKLTITGFLLDHLTDKNYNSKYMGFCKYKSNPVRRIDIRYVPYNSLPTAMLYFTGPYELNTVMRNMAKKKHMLLSEYGLYNVDDNDIRTPIIVRSEEDVFKILGMDYLTPVERELFNTGKAKPIKS